MRKYAYIFPNGEIFHCDGQGTENHIETVKTFLRGLERLNEPLYNKLVQIFRNHYYGVNYDDFAIFTLGWIKISSHFYETISFAGYDFQHIILSLYSVSRYKLDVVDNFYKYPFIKLVDINYEEIIDAGRML